MNDSELDEILEHWTAPPMRDSLREELRTAFTAVPRPAAPARSMRRIPLGRIALAAIAATLLVFGIVQLSPKTATMASPGFHIPFYVEFVFATQRVGGSAPHYTHITSFPYAGHEITMSITESGDSLLNTLRRIAGVIQKQVILLEPSLVLPKEPPMAEPAWFAGFVSSGCSSGKNVVGNEIIAGHPTTVVQNTFPTHRITTWMAPDLACFALKLTHEEAQPDGTYKLRIRKEAIKVTMNP